MIRSKEEFWNVAGFVADFMPVVVRCDGDEWKAYFDDYTLIDAVAISKSELWGIDYAKRVHFKPAWLTDAERTNTLVLTGLDRLPVRSDDPNEKTQIDFAHLARDKDEDDAYRELGIGTGIFVPRDLRTFIVLPYQHALDPFFFSRCAQVELGS